MKLLQTLKDQIVSLTLSCNASTTCRWRKKPIGIPERPNKTENPQ